MNSDSARTATFFTTPTSSSYTDSGSDVACTSVYRSRHLASAGCFATRSAISTAVSLGVGAWAQ